MADSADDIVRGLVKAVEDGQISYDKLSKGMSKLGLTISKTEKEFSDTIDSMKKLQDEIEDLEKKFEAASSDEDRRNITKDIAAKKQLKEEEYNAAKKVAQQKAIGAAQTAVVKGFVTAFSDATKKAMSGGSALEISAGFMESGIDASNNAVQAGTGVMESFGKSMEGTTGKTAAMGTAVVIASKVIGGLSSAISDLAKQGISFMMHETNLMLGSFIAMSNVGAIYVGGMKEMVDVSLSAGMTIDQFTKAIVANKDEFAKAGLSVGDGSKRMAAAMKAGGESARNGMFALGMTMEDQADATAKTMALMAGPSGRLISSNAEISKQTEEYAQNLKIVSDITGEDAKAKQAEIQKENDTLFMKQKLNAMEPAQRIKFNEMLQNMNGVQRQALAEQMKYGSVISTNLAAAQATSPGIMQANRDFYKAVLDGSMSGEKARDIQMRNADQIKKDSASQTSLSIATGQTAEGMSKVIGSYWDTAAEFSENATKASQDAAKTAQAHGKAVSATVGGTSAVDLMAANQNFAIGMQQIAADNLPAFSKALTQTITDIQGAVKAVAGATVSATTGVMDFISAHKTTLINTALVAGGAALTSTVIGAGFGAEMMAVGGAGLASQAMSSGFADGGISSGPVSGYAQKLHGNELIVPLKGNELDKNSKGYDELSKRTNTSPSVTTDPELTSSSIESAKLLRRLVELNERILSINEKTLHAVA